MQIKCVTFCSSPRLNSYSRVTMMFCPSTIPSPTFIPTFMFCLTRIFPTSTNLNQRESWEEHGNWDRDKSGTGNSTSQFSFSMSLQFFSPVLFSSKIQVPMFCPSPTFIPFSIPMFCPSPYTKVILVPTHTIQFKTFLFNDSSLW